MTLIYASRTPSDILLKDELSDWVTRAHGRFTLVHVIGDGPESKGKAPTGWASTSTYTADGPHPSPMAMGPRPL